MSRSEALLSPAEAASQLGVSAKALRLYERHGLIAPARNMAGWRFYGGADMARARDVVALRQMGMSLSDVAKALAGEAAGLDALLARHQERLDRDMAALAQRRVQLGQLRQSLASGIESGALATALAPMAPALSLNLPWPWGGERFALADLNPVTYLTGPLGSGKTQLAQALARHVPGARFVGMDRLALAETARAEDADVQAPLGWLIDDGASASPALVALLVALCDSEASVVVVDLIEDGLDEATQEALGAWLRRYDNKQRPLVAMTRSSALLDLEQLGPADRVIYCPANHSPPQLVVPIAGAAGYEAVASCLAPVEVRERTAGMVARMG